MSYKRSLWAQFKWFFSTQTGCFPYLVHTCICLCMCVSVGGGVRTRKLHQGGLLLFPTTDGKCEHIHQTLWQPPVFSLWRMLVLLSVNKGEQVKHQAALSTQQISYWSLAYGTCGPFGQNIYGAEFVRLQWNQPSAIGCTGWTSYISLLYCAHARAREIEGRGQGALRKRQSMYW